MPEWLSQLGIMGYPLATASVLAVAVILERSYFFLRNSVRTQSTYSTIESVLLKNANKPKQVRDELVSFLLSQQQRHLNAGIKWLRLVGVISPMLGLLGTVLGMIMAFKAIAANVGPVNPNLVADGLWEAMLTTAVGLAIALPCLLAAHFFKSIADSQIEQWEWRLNQLSLSFEGVELNTQENTTNIKPMERKAA